MGEGLKRARVAALATQRPDPLKPSVALLSKLGSIAVHVEEMLSPTGHSFDRVSLEVLLADSEVRDWLHEMDRFSFLPKKRRERS